MTATMTELGEASGDWSYDVPYTAVAVYAHTVPAYYGHTETTPRRWYGLGWWAWCRDGRFVEPVIHTFYYMEVMRPHAEYGRVDGHFNPGIEATVYGVEYS